MHRWRSHWNLQDLFLSLLFVSCNGIPYRSAFSVESLFSCTVFLFSDFSMRGHPKHGIHVTVKYPVPVCLYVLSLNWCELEAVPVSPVKKLAIVWQCDHSFKCSSKWLNLSSVDVFGILAQHDNFLGSLLTPHPLHIIYIIVFECVIPILNNNSITLRCICF